MTEWILIIMLGLQTNAGIDSSSVIHSIKMETFATQEDCVKIGNLVEQEYLSRGGFEGDITIKCEEIGKR